MKNLNYQYIYFNLIIQLSLLLNYPFSYNLMKNNTLTIYKIVYNWGNEFRNKYITNNKFKNKMI